MKSLIVLAVCFLSCPIFLSAQRSVENQPSPVAIGNGTGAMGNGRETAVLVGKVTLNGNAALPQNANVVLECGATEPRAHGFSDSKGNFSITVAATWCSIRFLKITAFPSALRP